ncbi:polysaccharide pyruvyl transferase family protein [Vibrio parahaemolyticus]|uniref:polysaccharide pyruvyl transferase family protein n=1 Tax=Vibrio parahaemolyticus TaxID=670 RepID=UPI001F45B6EC|nr:polysaccharide pyruvyl transferase family protein [Vibrio parahaemolyticus]EGV1829504.1 polysaccharide pyruvyl transferase family protein [Vibrio parahaemolyticus]EHW0647847.1 polysaccharide pyruvyl transferase family protein [Vibrio parahaemolyticus]MCG0028224.1 polysaccharide pyruvyl transferase family protein [Vibrio parahaemolyticus]
MKNKSLLLTFSYNYNYGAILQTYAMIKALDKIGIDCELPKYVPHYVSGNAAFYRGIGIKGPTPLKSISKRLRQYKRYKKFDKFRNEYLPINKKLNSIESLKINIENYSSVITGSDQTWNTNWMKEFESFYFQGFYKNKKVKKVSYASCFGNYEQPEKYTQKIADCLSDFDHVAVRNDMSQKVYESITKKECRKVVDPTLLHDFSDLVKPEWEEELDIILVYALDVHNLQEGQRIANELQELGGGKIVFINGEKSIEVDWADELRNDKGPLDWLEYFYRAKYIVTDSFHGCVFATKFQKKFVPYTQGWRAGRIENFCQQSGINDILINEKSIDRSITEDYWNTIDWNNVSSKLIAMRKDSLEYLVSVISE